MGLVTALGGRTLRDVLIGETLASWMTNIYVILMVFITVPIAYLFRNTIYKMGKVLFVFDTLGISLYTLLGLHKTLDIGLNPIAVILMGTISPVLRGGLLEMFFQTRFL